MLKQGMFLQERYEIISRIGSGGMADVYKAKDHKLNRFVAVKVLKQEYREDKAFISKFRVEAQSAAGLAHPNIVNVYDVGDDKGVNFIVMELVEGITLKDYIEKKGRLAVREATSIAIQAAMGLEAAHRNKIVHCDVKPQNIIISTDGKVKVTDFGIAKAATTHTISSNVMGSVHYSSPEQARGGYSDFKSDIYSLGVTTYEMLTGHVPFDGDTTVAIAIKHLQEEMQSPRKYVPDLPKSTVQIIYKCTQKSPDRRYGDMDELVRDLKESLVNPEGDFVQIVPLTNHAQTVVISKDDLDQIKNGITEGTQGNENNMGAGAADSSYGNYAHDGYGNAPGSGYYDEQDEEDEDEEDEKEHPKLEKFMTVGSIVIGIIILLIFLALVGNAVGLLDFDFLSGKKNSTESVSETVTEETSTTEAVEEVIVPDITGMTKQEATDALYQLGLGAQYGGEKESSRYAAGLIMSQTPAAGSSMAKNTTVTYFISKGQNTITVPELSGKTLEEAQAQLSALGLTIATDYAFDNNVTQGLIIYSNPASGTAVTSGETVTVVISKGQQQTESSASEEITMPDVVGSAWSSAKSTLENQGLYVNINEEVSSTVAAGNVISQSISAGTSVSKGTAVTLTVSLGAGDPEETNGSAAADQNNNPNLKYACNVNLREPSNYNGEPVKIVLIQDGKSTTVVNGSAVTFPYTLNYQGTSDSLGTAYVYILDAATGAVTREIKYPNVAFLQVT